MANYQLTVDSKNFELEAEPNKPLLWVLREDLGFTSTKFGCGYGVCGACSVYVDETLVRACVYPISSAAGKQVSTISGLDDELVGRLKAAWQKYEVPQCGYCQPGFILAAHKLLKNTAPDQTPNWQDLSNLCRCGTYDRIRQAIVEVHRLNHEVP